MVGLLGHFRDLWAPAGQFTCVHPTCVPLRGGLGFKLAYNRVVVLFKISEHVLLLGADQPITGLPARRF